MNSSLAERFSIILSTGIHLGEFFLGQEVFFETLLPERFFIALSAGIHLGEFFLGREILDTCISDLLEGVADKHDFIECGASLKPSSIKNPRERRPLGKKIEGRKEYYYDTYKLKYIFKWLAFHVLGTSRPFRCSKRYAPF